MKFKYPKVILIGETAFHITYDSKNDDASFQYPYKGKKAYIKFGMQNHKINPVGFLHMVIHELKEIIQIEQSTRIKNYGKEIYEFHYNHNEHQNTCCRLAGLLTNFIK